MIFIKDSFTIVLLGDWNKKYIQPEWIAENVYEKNEIEIGIHGRGTDIGMSCRCNNVIIEPKQSQVVFTIENMSEDILDYVVKCVNNFLQKATDPTLFEAFGFNCEYQDSDNSQFAEVIDSMKDNIAIIESGYEVSSAKISRTLIKGNQILNLDSMFIGTSLKMNFNEHHDVQSETEIVEISVEEIKHFLGSCKDITVAFGYELEDDE